MDYTKIVLRFDDICPTMSWAQWYKAKDLMDSLGLNALLGVIPDCRDKDLLIDKPNLHFWEYIKELQDQGYVIAMHGLNHVYDSNKRGIVNKRRVSEFAGHSYEMQYSKIKKGKEILMSHGIETDIFFAPAHSYDNNTLKALRDNGFHYISDGKSRKPYIKNGIKCIPCKANGIPIIKHPGLYTAVMHAHEWLQPGKEKTWLLFKKLCEERKEEIVSFHQFQEQTEGMYLIEKFLEHMYMFKWRVLSPIYERLSNR